MGAASLAHDRRMRARGIEDAIGLLHRCLADLQAEVDSETVDRASASMAREWLHRAEHRMATESVRLAREAAKIEGLSL